MTALIIITLVVCGIMFLLDLCGVLAGDPDDAGFCMVQLPPLGLAIVTLSIVLGVYV